MIGENEERDTNTSQSGNKTLRTRISRGLIYTGTYAFS